MKPSDFEPAAAITLLTDFGHRGPYVGAMRGVLARDAPGIPILDISHDVPVHDVVSGGFMLAASAPYFPTPAVHVAVVDPGVGTSRRVLVVSRAGHQFVGPDNGLLTLVIEADDDVDLFAVEIEPLGLPQAHPTFHGRDVFAPIAARLARGTSATELGRRIDDPQRWPSHAARQSRDGWELSVLFVDRFGNVTTNLSRAQLASWGGDPDDPVPLSLGSTSMTWHATYGLAPHDTPFLLWGSSGYLELALREESAAQRLGLTTGDRIVLAPA